MQKEKINEFVMKDGREIKVELWDFEELENIARELKTWNRGIKGSNILFDGFNLFGPSTIQDMKFYNTEAYSSAKKLTPLEIQTDKNLSNTQYHKSLAAICNGDLAGILVCWWIKDNLPFWRYHMKILDIKNEYQNNSIGTNLIKTLNNLDFINFKIIQEGGYSAQGFRYIKKIIDKEITGKRYALIPHDYFILNPPLQPGIYNNLGEPINSF